MDSNVSSFITFLEIEKNASPLTIKDYSLELKKFYAYLDSFTGSCSLSEINTQIIRDYLYKIKIERKLCATSVYKKIAIIKSYFNYLFDAEIISSNPTARIKMPKKERSIPKVVSYEDFLQIIDCMKFSPARCRKNLIRDNLIFHMLYYCGLRRQELLNLNWDDINLNTKVLYVRKSKNKSSRILPIHDKVMELLDSYLSLRLPITNNALIIGESNKRFCLTSFKSLINMYLTISNLKKKGYSAHSFRHGFATKLIEKNVNIFMVQRLLGHSSLDTTKIYVHFDDKNLKDAVSML